MFRAASLVIGIPVVRAWHLFRLPADKLAFGIGMMSLSCCLRTRQSLFCTHTFTFSITPHETPSSANVLTLLKEKFPSHSTYRPASSSFLCRAEISPSSHSTHRPISS
ncbi:hypothetical protein BDV97DRAFT_347780 [Delphinella strobiligena]|nr:hypothetical protein BDV97DRAFT_347780 [Delphinella strobiligena]